MNKQRGSEMSEYKLMRKNYERNFDNFIEILAFVRDGEVRREGYW